MKADELAHWQTETDSLAGRSFKFPMKIIGSRDVMCLERNLFSKCAQIAPGNKFRRIEERRNCCKYLILLAHLSGFEPETF